MKYLMIFLLAMGAFVILQNHAYAMCVYDPNSPPVTCDDTIGTLDYPITPEELIPSPLKQMSLGIKLGHVICDDAHVLTYKTDYSPACVFPDSEGALLTRGWAKLRLLLPAGPDPIKELELTGQNELSYRITGNVIYGNDESPLSNDRIKEIVNEYSQKHYPDKQYLEYSIPTVHPFIEVEDKVEFDLLEWGNYSDCGKLKLQIIDVQNKPVYENTLTNYCLESDVMSSTFHSYSMGKDFEEFACPHPGYYRIEVSNADVFPPKILQNFVCLEYKPEPEPESESISDFGNSVSDFNKATSGTLSWANMPTYIPNEYVLKDIRFVDTGGIGSMINLIYLKEDIPLSDSDTLDDIRKQGMTITYTQGERLDSFDWNTFVKDFTNDNPKRVTFSEKNGHVMLIEAPDLKKPWPGKTQIQIGDNDVFVMSLNLDTYELEKILWSIVENEN